MKWMVASDIHGSAYYCEKMLEAYRESGAEKLVILGDILYHGPRNDLPKDYAPKKVIAMLNEVADELLCVRGNCEAEVDQMVLPFPCLADYSMVMDGEVGFYLTHGHHASPDHMPPLNPGTIFLSGHTHIKLDEMRSGIRCVNPGSVSIPKDGSHSCMVWDSGDLRTVILED